MIPREKFNSQNVNIGLVSGIYWGLHRVKTEQCKWFQYLLPHRHSPDILTSVWCWVLFSYLFIYSSIHISNQNQYLKYTNRQCGLNGEHRDKPLTYVPPQWKIHKYKDSNNHTCTHKTYNLPKIAYDRSVILTAILNCFRFRARTVEAGNLFHSVTTRTGKE